MYTHILVQKKKKQYDVVCQRHNANERFADENNLVCGQKQIELNALRILVELNNFHETIHGNSVIVTNAGRVCLLNCSERVFRRKKKGPFLNWIRAKDTPRRVGNATCVPLLYHHVCAVFRVTVNANSITLFGTFSAKPEQRQRLLSLIRW